MVLLFLCYFKGNKMLQKLLNYLFKKQIFTKDLNEMTPDDFISKYLLDKCQTVVRENLAHDLYNSNNKHWVVKGARQTGKTLGVIFSILYRVLRLRENTDVYIVSYNKSNSKRIMRIIKDILLRIQPNIGFKISKNNTENFIIYTSNKIIRFEVLSLNRYTMRGCESNNCILFADETSFFDKSYNDALNETMEYILSNSKNSLFVSTMLG